MLEHTRSVLIVKTAHIALIVTALGMSACRSPLSRDPTPPAPLNASSLASPAAPPPSPPAPYPQSHAVPGVSWDFSKQGAFRAAIGSDLWPCTWARDDNLYCAWGDGGGFDGNDDQVGRASLGFARISGNPGENAAPGFIGRNVWGTPPYAEHPASFGGKVNSMISIDGVLYAIGGLWTVRDAADPVHKGENGPMNTLLWSTDLGKTWRIAPWSTPASLGTFLNFGRDNAGAIDDYVYIYYLRQLDSQHLYLKRVAKHNLRADPSAPGRYQYLTGVDPRGRPRGWSRLEPQAAAIFFDPNNVDSPEIAYDAKLHRYLLSLGHYASGRVEDSSLGQLGLFEAPHPWGPWETVGYYQDWGGYGASASGDFLGLRMPLKWISADGKTLWCIFSGPREFDAFNVVKATLQTAGSQE
jgi:hypothetical protein